MKRSRRRGPQAHAALLLATAIVLILPAPGCGPGEKPEGSRVNSTSKFDDQAVEVLKGMTDKLSEASQITIRATQETDPALLEMKDKPESASLTATLKRPDRFLATTTSEDRERRIFYDGETFSMFYVSENFYAQKKMPGDFDAMAEQLQEKFGFAPPVSELLLSDPYAYLMDGLQSLSYVGEESVEGTPCHHLSAVEESITWNVWITVDELLLLELVATATSIEGQPEIRVQVAEIDLSAQLDDAMFAFEPPPGATKIRMVPVDEIYEE
jgi:hypothetical protein